MDLILCSECGREFTPKPKEAEYNPIYRRWEENEETICPKCKVDMELE